MDILQSHFSDTVKGRVLGPDGKYMRVAVNGKSKGVRSQEKIYAETKQRLDQTRRRRRSVFDPHKPPDAPY
jgi:polyphosphate kinase